MAASADAAMARSRQQVITRPGKRAFRPIVAHRGAYQGDIAFFKYSNSPSYREANENKTCIMLAVEVATRYAYAVPMATKNTQDVIRAFSAIYQCAFDENARIIELTTDSGSEFGNTSWNTALTDTWGIRQYVKEPDDHYSLGIIDRLTRTLKTMVENWQIQNNSLSWLEGLRVAVTDYNNRMHSTLGVSPNSMRKYPMLAEQVIAGKHNQAKRSSGARAFEQLAERYRSATRPILVRIRLMPGEQPRDVGRRAEVGRDTAPGKVAKGVARWSNQVYTISGINGYSIELTDQNDKKMPRSYRVHELLVVPNDSVSVPDVFEGVAREDRHERRRKHEGLD